MTETPEPTDTAPDAAAPPSRRRRWSSLAPWLVALLATAAALYATVQWRDLADREAVRDDVAAASASFLTTLTTWDAGDGLDDTRASLEDAGTDGFRSEVDDLFGGSLGEALEEAGASSSGEVQDLFVQSIEGDDAVVFAVITQRVETGEDEPRTTARSARLALVRTGDGWLVDRVDLLEDAALTGGTEDAP